MSDKPLTDKLIGKELQKILLAREVNEFNREPDQLEMAPVTGGQSLNSKLEEHIARPGITRKVSQERTEECPVWNAFEDLWMESDAQLRERLKAP